MLCVSAEFVCVCVSMCVCMSAVCVFSMGLCV